ncbi:MAG: ABC transporter ATP-binding protein [Lachnospirales bacterium]
MKKIIEAKNITKEYIMGEVKVMALQGATLDLYENELVVILGPSGSGKSTILNILGGIDKPTNGDVIYRGESIVNYNERKLTNYRRDAIGFVFQFYNLVPNLTAKENILLASRLSNNPLNVDEILSEIELEDRANHFPSQMSGGQQQRVAIGRAIAKNPDILLCDEPTGALDLSTGVNALKLLKKFNVQYKKTIAIITHNKSIGEMADRVIYVKDGKIHKIESNQNPKNPEEVIW